MLKRVLLAASLLLPALAAAQPTVPLDTFWMRHFVGNPDPATRCWNQAADILYDSVGRKLFVAGSGEWDYNGQSDMVFIKYHSEDGLFRNAIATGGVNSQAIDMGQKI